MRNGMNISGFSEIVHEVQREPQQALFRYGAYARCSPTGDMLAGVHPATIGTLRAPRCFEVPVRPGSSLAAYGMLEAATPRELALIALSGCFLVSAVSGFSARRTTVGHLSMTTRASMTEGDTLAPQVRYQIRSLIDKKISEVVDVIEAVKSHSPNHQSFVQPLPLSVSVIAAGEPLLDLQFPAQAEAGASLDQPQKLALDCQWLYGTQLRADFQRQDASDRRSFLIDQPKQLAGIDCGPNPQEYLLMAIAADVLQQLATRFPLDDTATLDARAMVDIRGMCDVAPTPVHLQDIELKLSLGSRVAPRVEELEQALAQSIAQSQVCALIRRPVQFEFHIGHDLQAEAREVVSAQ
ncbi:MULTISPECIES: OsmC family protein [Pseudomonas aeruginosa group]|uniref:OsmC family protein n=1 Tax=Pseudomonas aeruginosa group TaxID=136841 RepID=UPI001A196E49|nr:MULTISPECIES: OsmC family protein [Pseudomonas aeruginosa group]MBG6886137.1 OsmC family protein [Pseudomonas aeruginosa]MCY0315501.1 OsmC family protein [Pseudomonas aeruginosa]MCY0517478.1 OsmC family protein [Pseudomonas aeruginosa]MDI3610677.1 OsmC family protein [Pseudomonas aeruginosa]MDI3677540.1 OsmC family protein [Pseudomonas aeruginosa]